MKLILSILIIIILSASVSIADKPDIYLERGRVALLNNNFQSALTNLNKAIELDTTNFEAFYYRGLVLLYMNKYLLSIEDFSQAIKLNPEFADTYNNRGLAYSFVEDLEKAYYDFSKAIELDSKFAEAYINRGSIYTSIGENDSAMVDFNRAAKINPNNPELLYQRGRLHYNMSNFNDAINDFTKSIELGLSSPKIYYNRANAYVRSNQYDKAVVDYTHVLELDPEDMEALNNRSYAYNRLGLDELAENDKANLEKLRAKLFPPVNIEKFNRISDSAGVFSIEVPDGWHYWFSEHGYKTDMLISKDFIDPKSDALIYGAIAGFINELPPDVINTTDDEILEFWYNQQVFNTQNFAQYNMITQKNMRFKGWTGYQNVIRVQYARGYMTYIITEFVITHQGKLFFCHLQVPEQEYESYKHVFERMINSITIVF